ncbi:glycine-rich domain-containing protein [Photobacterium sp. 53610]|uniref:glycine-rich domain-containing protein n=1 Tax=Photobacterium sp. 53610 TaxID=3102789 RepID=UPI002ED7A359
MNTSIFVFITLIPLGIIAYVWIKTTTYLRTEHIKKYRFPPPLKAKVKACYPHLSDDEIELVFEALRDYFLICSQTPLKAISMPSKIVDVAWHEFILATKTYHHFCQKSFGRYFHHSPDWESNTTASRRLRNEQSWRFICLHEQISPGYPREMPLLFSIDEQLNIEDGFCYHHSPRKRSIHVSTIDSANEDGWFLYCKTPLCSEDDDDGSEGDYDDDNYDDCNDSSSHNDTDNDYRNGSDTNDNYHYTNGFDSDSSSQSCSGSGGCSSCSSCSSGGD